MRVTSLVSIGVLAGIGLFGCGSSSGSGADAGIPNNGVRPGKRSDIAGVVDPSTGQLVVFGGDNGPIVNQTPMPMYVGDTWVLDPSEGWTEVAGNAPSARGRYAVALDPAGRMLAFGGRFRAGTSGPYQLFNDLWAFDFATQSWSQLSDGSGGPTPRYFSTAAFDEGSGKFYVFGGGTNTDPLALSAATDVWSFDGAAWTLETVTGEAPSSRLFMAYAYDSSRNRLVAFGGQIGDFLSPGFNDLYALDLGTMVWSRLDTGVGTAPTGRFSAMLTYDSAGDQYLLFGGHADPGVANDVWSFNPTGATWQKLGASDSFTGSALGCLGNSRELPKDYVTEDLSSPERRSGGAMAMAGSELLVFGGESDCSDHLDDVWSFNLESQTWSERLTARSGESCARQGNDCQCLCL